MVEVKCSQCGKPYQVKPYLTVRFGNHFCSQQCYGEWQKMHRIGLNRKRIVMNCSTCGKQIERRPSEIRPHMFCSSKCLGHWRSIASSNEKSLSWLGGHTTYRGKNWPEMKALAVLRDKNQCQRCGTGHNLAVHHKVPYHLHKNYREANVLGNLETLCGACHSKTEIEFWKAHPGLVNNRVIPDCTKPIKCLKCGSIFLPRSGRTAYCDACCLGVCSHCGNTFYDRRLNHRKVKYCSMTCFVNHVKVTLPEQICPGCGKSFIPTRNDVSYCSKHCYLTKANPRRLFFAKQRASVAE